MQIPTWLVPSFYGDIRLQATGPRSCLLIADRLTEREKEALGKLTETARSKAWMDSARTLGEGKAELEAPVDKVAQVLAKALKPGRKIVSAVRFFSGRMEEVTETTFADEPEEPIREPGSGSTMSDDAPVERPPVEVLDKPTAAASVAAPYRGCPAPDFPSADVKAREVLLTFLDAGQAEDFDRYNRFISVGATTGTRYMITSRHARDQLALWHRSLYDLDKNLPLCVHDWDVPAAEEMLALHLLLQLPGWENYLRRLED